MKNVFHHIAIVVDNIETKTESYCKAYSAQKLGPVFIDNNQRVKVQFIETGNMKIELLEPLGGKSPVSLYLQKHGSGKIYHVAYEVDDLDMVVADVKSRGGLIVSRTKDGWQGWEVVFAVFFIDKTEQQIIEYVKRKG